MEKSVHKLSLYGIPEMFNAADFCALIKTGVFQTLNLDIAHNTSRIYRENFKAAVKEMKKQWPSDTPFPYLYIKNC